MKKYLFILVFLIGCKTKYPIIGSYKNGNNIIELNKNNFIFKSFYSLEGYYLCEGNYLLSSNRITLFPKNKSPHVELSYELNSSNISEIIVSNFGCKGFDKLELLINGKNLFNDFEESIMFNDKISSIQLIDRESKDIIFEKQIESKNYYLKILIGDIANSFFLEDNVFRVKKGFLINLKNGVKYKKCK